MKLSVCLAIFLMSCSSYAATTLNCSAEDGSYVSAVEDSEQKGVFYQVQIRIREGVVKSYPEATVAVVENNGLVDLLVIKEPTQGLLVVATDNTFIDASGIYGIEHCEISK